MHIGGPIPVVIFPALQVLDISSNGFTSALPPSIIFWSALQVLNVSYSIPYGSIPDDIGNLTALRVFNFAANGFTGEYINSYEFICCY